MNNNTNGNVNGTVENQGQPQVPQVPQQPMPQNGATLPPHAPQQIQYVYVPEQKHGFGQWCKDHWKALAAWTVTIIGGGVSGAIAYKKGKAAGAATLPPVQQAYNPLDPNNE